MSESSIIDVTREAFSPLIARDSIALRELLLPESIGMLYKLWVQAFC